MQSLCIALEDVFRVPLLRHELEVHLRVSNPFRKKLAAVGPGPRASWMNTISGRSGAQGFSRELMHLKTPPSRCQEAPRRPMFHDDAADLHCRGDGAQNRLGLHSRRGGQSGANTCPDSFLPS
jgi:hypothetical protein